MNKFIYASVLLLASCSKGQDKAYYESGNIREVHFRNNKNKIDSSVFYYNSEKSNIKQIKKIENGSSYIKNFTPNGRISSEGYKNGDSIRTGKWSIYGAGDTTKIFEYKNIRGNEYLNQSWIKNTKGDTIRGNYLHFEYNKDTVKVNELVSFRFYLEGYMFSEKSELIFVSPKNGNDFSKNFFNEYSVEKDTVKSLKYDGLNKHLNHLPLNHILISNFKFSTPGKKTIRGILKEIYEPEEDSITMKERNIYFEKDIYVKRN